MSKAKIAAEVAKVAADIGAQFAGSLGSSSDKRISAIVINETRWETAETYFWTPTRGVWDSSPDMPLRGTGEIIEKVEKAHNDPANTMGLADLVRAELTLDWLRESSARNFTGKPSPLRGFKGIFDVYIEEKKLQIMCFIGKVPNLPARAGVMMVHEKSDGKYFFEATGKEMKFRNNSNDVEEDMREYSALSRYDSVAYSSGGSVSAKYDGIKVTFSAGYTTHFRIFEED